VNQVLRSQTIVFCALLILVLASFFSSFAALLCASLFLLLVPGYFVVRSLRVELEPLVLVGVSIAASLLLSTQLVYWLSLALGYSTQTILFSFFLWSCLAFAVDFKQLYKRKELAASLREHLPVILGCLAAFAAVFLVLNQTLWVETSEGVVVGGYNWADFFVHLSIIQSVNAGNFPPQTPYASGIPLSYHWFGDFHTAIFSKLSQVFPAFVVRFENALYAALLFLGSFALAHSLCRSSKDAKKIAFFAALFVVFGSGLAWTQFFGDAASGGNPLDLVKQTNYDGNSHSESFPVMSTMTYLLVQRPQAIALPVFAFALLLAFEGFASDKRKLLLAGILCALLAPFQYVAFACLVASFAVIFLLKWLEERRLRLKEAALLFLPPVLGAIGFSAQVASVQLPLKLEFAWLAPKDPFGAVFFYFANFGIPMALGLLALLLTKDDLREKKTLFALAALFFVIPNVVTATAFQWDMVKFFSYSWIPLCVLAAAALVKLKKWLWIPLAAAAIASPLFFLAWSAQSNWIALTPAELSAVQWMQQNLPERAVVANYWEQNSPVEAAGGLRIAPPDWIGFSHLLPYEQRYDVLRKVYCGSAEESVAALKQYGAKFVLLGSEEKSNFHCAFAFASDPRFAKRFDSQGIQVFELRE